MGPRHWPTTLAHAPVKLSHDIGPRHWATTLAHDIGPAAAAHAPVNLPTLGQFAALIRMFQEGRLAENWALAMAHHGAACKQVPGCIQVAVISLMEPRTGKIGVFFRKPPYSASSHGDSGRQMASAGAHGVL